MKNVASTSKEIYHKEIKVIKEDSQDQVVYNAVKKFCNAVSMRQVQRVTGLEINVVSRSLNNLCQKKQLIENVFEARCSITGKKVKHYKVKE